MGEANRRNRHRERPRGGRAEPRAARKAGALLLSACVLVACSNQDTSHRAAAPEASGAPEHVAGPTPSPQRDAPGRTRSPALRSTPAEVRPVLPPAPAGHDAAALARQIEVATATLRSRRSTAAEVREAAEFQQLAVHSLATGSDGYARKVQARLRPRTAMVTGNAVRASRLLRKLTDPMPTMPPWHILAPPPPKELRGYYHDAQRRTGVPWTYLAAIHLVESRMGRIRGPSTAGARGPMQFLPSTWDLYGAGGDINDPHDAVLAAARLLVDNGAPRDMAGALFHYNPSSYYVRAVTAFARTIQRAPYTYRGYWHWRVLFRHRRGTYVLPVGYPRERPVPLRGE
jgi:hypothetical protein